MTDDLQEACGVFGCVSTNTDSIQVDVAHIICLGLVGLQHRGQESAGIVCSQGPDHRFLEEKGLGLVNNIFNEEKLQKLKGSLGIGHNRYSTAGCVAMMNCQPFVVETLHGHFALAHNGELVNANGIKKKLLEKGVGLSTGSDTELISQILSIPPGNPEENGPNWCARLKQLTNHTAASFSLLLMYKDVIYAMRDPVGNRPLCIGKLIVNNSDTGTKSCEAYVVSSESCPFQSFGASYYREIIPGEIVEISKHGIKSLCVLPMPQEAFSAFCIFEYVYFARADSILEGQMVYSARLRCGQQLAIESPVDADIVSTVPETAAPAAIGFSTVLGIQYMEVLCKNRYVGRTFIQPSTRLRQLGVAKKFGALFENFQGKRIVLIDDSIVRGNTMGPIISLLKRSGAKEVHIRIASPPLHHPCYMGINIPTADELIANRVTQEELPAFLGADSVKYLSVEGLVSAIQSGIENNLKNKTGHCTACLTGKYPVPLKW